MSVPDWEGLPEDFSPESGLELLRERLLTGTGYQRLIAEAGVRLTCLLLLKNDRYGNSALEPLSVFARGISPAARLAVRMDDKVNRIVQGVGVDGGDAEDPRVDLAGYLVLDVVRTWVDG